MIAFIARLTALFALGFIATGLARGALTLRLTRAVAIGMARKSTLEGRMLALLDDRRDRRSTSRASRVMAMALGASAVALVVSLRPVSAAAARGRQQAEREKVEMRTAANELQGKSYSRTVDVNGQTELSIELRTARSTRQQASSENGFEIHVPRTFNVTIESSGGELSISDVNGTFRGNIAGGEVTLNHIRGRAELSTGDGEIRVYDSQVEGTVSTALGNVRLSRVTGSLKGVTSKGEVSTNDELARVYPARGRDGQEYTLADKSRSRLDLLGRPEEERLKEMSKEPAELVAKLDRLKDEAKAKERAGEKGDGYFEFIVEKPVDSQFFTCDNSTVMTVNGVREIATRLYAREIERSLNPSSLVIGLSFDSSCRVVDHAITGELNGEYTTEDAIGRMFKAPGAWAATGVVPSPGATSARAPVCSGG